LKKILLVVFAIGALVWAKKRFLDAPAPVAPSKAEVTAEKIGKIAKTHIARSKAAPDEGGLAAMVASLMPKEDSAPPEAKAKKRMEAVMASWKEGGTSLNDAAQAAACLWSRGVHFIPDKDEINDAAMGFDKWRQSKALYTDIQSYAVGEVIARENHPGRSGDYSVIEVTINGDTHRIGIPDSNNPLFWVQ
jgi:hypothetical protein